MNKYIFLTLAAAIVLAVGTLMPGAVSAQSASKDAEIDRLVGIIEQLTATLNAGGGAPTSINLPTASTPTYNVPTGTVAGVSTAACPYAWSRSLTVGDRGVDVMKLQQFLNTQPDTRVASYGAGAPGLETQYFGQLTANAVARFQAKYAAEVLYPVSVFSPTGYFGPSTRGKVNALCGSPVPPPSDGDDGRDNDDDQDDRDDDDDDDRRGDIDDLRGEGELDQFEIDDASDDDIAEGAEDEVIAELTLEADHGDLLLDRMKIALVGVNSPEEDEPWDVFEEISLWVDGDPVERFEADDEDEYLDEDEGTFRFSNLDIILDENDEVDMELRASVQNGVDGAGTDAEWSVSVDEVRVFDADGVASDEDDIDDLGTAVRFSIDEEGGDDELRVRSSSDDPEATTLELEDDERSDFITVFAFDLDTEDSENDIEIETIRVDVDATEDGTTATSTSFLIDDAQLVIDGDEYDDVTITHGTTGTFVFDIDGDLIIDAGDRVTVEFELEFEALDSQFEGATIEASTDADVGYEAEGADDLSGSQFSGAASGEEHTLRSSGVKIEFEDEDFDFFSNSDNTTDDDEGSFTLEFDVTAFETDVYLNRTASRGTGSSDAGAEYLITSGGSTVGGGTTASSLSSTASVESGDFVVREGDTETFTLKVTYDPASSGFYALKLYNINFTTSSGGVSFQAQRALPAADFETDEYSI